MKIIIVSGFALVVSLYSIIEVKANDPEVDLVIVGARTVFELNKIAADITVITAEEIEKSAASSLIEVLRGVASIQVSDNATNATISIRGFSAEQAGSNTLILINGRRLNNSDLAAPQLASIQLSEILRIEILNSSAGVLYGDQAVGGVINIITKHNQQPFTELSAKFASFDSATFSLSTSVDLNQNWNLQFSARQKDTDNFRQHNEEELKQQHFAINYDRGKMGVTFAADFTDQDINTPGALLSNDVLIQHDFSRAEFSADFLKFKTEIYRLSSYINFAEDWLFEFELQNNEDDNRSLTSFIGFQSNSESTTVRKLFSFTPRFSKKYPTEFGTGNITLGVDYIESDYSFSLLGRSNEQVATSGYVNASHPIAENLIISGGIRYSEVEDDLVDAFTFSNGISLKNDTTATNLGLIYQYNNNTKIFANAEQNFRFAKVDEQAFTSPGVIGLDPQLGVSFDFGINTRFDETRVTFAIFQLKLKDEIRFDPTAPPPDGAFFQGANVNADKSTREGARLEVSHSLTEKLQLNLNTVWTDARFTSGLNKNNNIPGVSKNVHRLDIAYAIGGSSNLNLEYIYTGKRKQDGDNAGFFEELKSYSLLNLGYLHNFTDKLDNWKLSVRLNNLLDKDYINFAQFNGFYPAAGFNASINIRYRFDS